MRVVHVKNENVATACDVLSKMARKIISVELSHRVTSRRAKEHGDFHSRWREKIAGRFGLAYDGASVTPTLVAV